MRIATVTCHHVYNYGATLQAYALQSYLESRGHEVKVVDYRLPEHVRYEWLAPLSGGGRVQKVLDKAPVFKYVLLPLKRRGMLKTWGRKKAFDAFDREYMHFTEQTYRSIEELRDTPPQADLYVAGSDQIWNTDMRNGSDRGYYLDFGPKSVKRVSYAASFGVSKIKEGMEDFVREQLSRFDRISVREASGVDILRSLGYDGVHVLDPVFLLTKEEWISRLSLKDKQDNYILLYDFQHNDPLIRECALSLKKHTGMKIVSINDYGPAPYADVQVNNAGPREFLELLLGAAFVVCNSFHATAFSLIFQKDFYTFPLTSQRNSSRMAGLLSDAGLPDRFRVLKPTPPYACQIGRKCLNYC